MKNIVILFYGLFIITFAKGQEPVITMTTTKSPGATISFSLAANAANTTVQVDFGDGTKVDKPIGTSPTSITGNLVSTHTIKIYGTGITRLECQLCLLSTLDVTADLTLTYLNCSNNYYLAVLDVTQNTALIYLDCSGNPLTALDVTQNTALNFFSCTSNQLSTLDVTKNIALTTLQCEANQLTTLDLTLNTALNKLYCAYNQFVELDVSKNTALKEFDCHTNQIKALDISKNTALTYLSCGSNSLALLDVTKNTSLTNLQCQQNQLTFATLPVKKGSWSIYYYAPQNTVNITKSLNVGIELDLSSQNSINGNISNYTWKKKSGTILASGTDYTIASGKTTFIKTQTDSVYCEMTNATLPDFTGAYALKTTYLFISQGNAIKGLNDPETRIFIYQKTLFVNIPFNARVSIFDISGRLVLENPVYSGVNSLTIVNSGVYLVKITSNKGSITKRVIVE